MLIRCLAWSCSLALAAACVNGQELGDFAKRVTDFKLANGMRFLVLERRHTPVVSFHTYVDAGWAQDPPGRGGLARMMERMAAKGTAAIGSRDYDYEKKALDEIEARYDEYEAERAKGAAARPEELLKLEALLKGAIAAADGFSISNIYPALIDLNGGRNYRVAASADSTRGSYSLPSNRLDLWFLYQSEWLRRPVFREFYRERDALREEHRRQAGADLEGRMQEAVLGAAFRVSPYRRLAAQPGELENLRATHAEEFFRRNYVPSNLTVAMVGDVQAPEIRRLAERHFAGLPAGAAAPAPSPIEPPQTAEQRVTVESPNQPMILIGHRRPHQAHADGPALELIGGLLGGHESGRLSKELAGAKRIARLAFSEPVFPDGKNPCLFLVGAAPAAGHTVEKTEKVMIGMLERLQREPPEESELRRVKVRLRAAYVRRIESNAGMAAWLAFYHANFGDWRAMAARIRDIEKVTASEVVRVAQQYFVPAQRTVALTVASGSGRTP